MPVRPRRPRIKDREVFRRLHETIRWCERCGRTPPTVVLEVAHIVPRSKLGDDTEDNLLMLCRNCHRTWGHGHTHERREEMVAVLNRRTE